MDKRIELDNVQFQRRFGERLSENVAEYKGALYNIHFTKGLDIRNTASLHIYNCIFDGSFLSVNFDVCKVSTDILRSKNLSPLIAIHNTTFNDQFVLTKNCVR